MRSVELFAGAGGLALGLQTAGFSHEAVVEWDPDACQTLRENKNHYGWRFICEDVRKLDYRTFPTGIELLAGGVPCQPFSIAGKHKGYLDERDMFPEFVRAVRVLRPKAVLVENVRGLLRPSFANYFSYIEHTLRYPELTRKSTESWQQHHARLERYHTAGKKNGLSYNVVHHIVNAADFGVPQRRERVFIVGIRSDLETGFSFPTETHSQEALLYSQYCTGEYWDEHLVPRRKRRTPPQHVWHRVEEMRGVLFRPSEQRWRTVRDALRGLPAPATERRKSEPSLTHFLVPGAREYVGHTGSPLDEPAKTLKAGDHGVPGGENMLRDEDGSVRYFTIRESARLQTFPDEFIFQCSWTESMRQIGNAVPVYLADVIGRKLIATLMDTAAPTIIHGAPALQSAR
jgi:DNA (cytosine-5)-methyltransferase 1